MKYELGRKIMAKFVGLRAKSYSYLIDDVSESRKAKDTKKCDIKKQLKFENYKNCLEAIQLDNKYGNVEKNNKCRINIEKKKINIDSLKKSHKKSARNNKSI